MQWSTIEKYQHQWQELFPLSRLKQSVLFWVFFWQWEKFLSMVLIFLMYNHGQKWSSVPLPHLHGMVLRHEDSSSFTVMLVHIRVTWATDNTTKTICHYPGHYMNIIQQSSYTHLAAVQCRGQAWLHGLEHHSLDLWTSTPVKTTER